MTNASSHGNGPIRGDGAPRRSRFRFVLDQWRAVYVLVVILLIAGVFSATQLAEQIYPTMTFSRVIVIATSGDLAPALVQASISRPIEQQLATVLGVQQITANSTQGTAAIQVTFDPSVADVNVALQRVSTVLTAVQPSVMIHEFVKETPTIFENMASAVAVQTNGLAAVL
jgi:multidrug efflux pump subunit AcrB